MNFSQKLSSDIWIYYKDKGFGCKLYTQLPKNAFLITSNCTTLDFNWKFKNMKRSHWYLLALSMQKQVPVGFMDRSRSGVLEGSVWALFESLNFLNLHPEVKSYENRPWTPLHFLSNQNIYCLRPLAGKIPGSTHIYLLP